MPAKPAAKKAARKPAAAKRAKKPAGEASVGRRLTDQQQRFVAEYLRDNNATRAAIASGYSVRNASSLGYQLLQNPLVSDAVAKGKARLLQHANMSAEEQISDLVVLSKADMREIAEWDGEHGRIKPFDEIDTRPILEFSINKTTTTTKDGAVVVSEFAKVKLINPMHARKLLSELTGVKPDEAGGAVTDASPVKAYEQSDWDAVPS